ncbi:Eukaryotic translation initiation factor isoform 4E-2 [Vitis vinifera]|uniref:Eukaryotic translation initiation factor isoform 4E n=1 Tax=Vitis vinifera TaxID=29760 RepID=A0A438GYE3_VITVI|nr:Eukaryotic translation initiation factor isoform 4E-2 [Vitis vinifera]
MASEAAGMESGAAGMESGAAPTEAAKQPHRLERKWTFWFDNQSKPKQGAAWGPLFARLTPSKPSKNFGGISLARYFFNLCLYDQIFKPSKLPANADFHLFKAGVEPKWEDPECANGGKWTVASSRKVDGLNWGAILMRLMKYVVWLQVYVKGRISLLCGLRQQPTRLLRF